MGANKMLANASGYDFFLSYNYRDRVEVEKLYAALINQSFNEKRLRVFLDRENLSMSDFLIPAIGKALNDTTILLQYLTVDCLASNWAAYERGVILNRDPQNLNKRFYVLRTGKMKLPESIHIADEYYLDWQAGFTSKMIDDLVGLLAKAQTIQQPKRLRVLGPTDRRYWAASMAMYPVTNRHYQQFIQQTGHCQPAYRKDKRFNGVDYPVVGVSWHDAMAYCRWLEASLRAQGKIQATDRIDLATKAQWLAICTSNQRRFPWGDDPPTEIQANYQWNCEGTTPVNGYPSGALAMTDKTDVYDLIGNVWEWGASVADDPSQAYIFGGSWGSRIADLVSHEGPIRTLDKDSVDWFTGFRCQLLSGQ